MTTRHFRQPRLWMTAILGAVLAVPAQATALAFEPTDKPDDLLKQPVHGQAALSALSEDSAQLAQRNGMSSSRLEELLRTDRTMWLDQDGQLFVKEPTLSADRSPGESTPAQFPNSQTFQLHSRPGANRVIYLDFDGGAVSGTAWNDNFGVSTGFQPALDLDGDSGSWSQSEIDLIQGVFQRVAEDFRPFDVDVTTQQPSAGALSRDSSADQQFGTTVMITPSSEMSTKTCSGGCGGIAYIGIYNNVGNTYHQPALVFPQSLSWGEKYIAEATSHEAGHNLGLVHDGTSTVGYYAGHGNWAPIMGVGYDRPLAQWSQGEYPDANNTEDDLAVIQNFGLPLRPDDHGSTLGAATSLGAARRAKGVIETRNDLDVFAISRRCTSNMTVTVEPAVHSPNLDVRMRLFDASGTRLAVIDPASGSASFDVATGLNASVTDRLAAGTYFVEVDGTGVHNLVTGYSGYASLGQYTLSVSPDECPPSRPRIGTASPGAKGGRVTATATWRAPKSTGGSAITGYKVSALRMSAGGAILSKTASTVQPPATRQLTMRLPQQGNYRFQVKAFNAAGASPQSALSNLVAGR
jgi:hypothetical protein